MALGNSEAMAEEEKRGSVVIIDKKRPNLDERSAFWDDGRM